MLYCYAIRVVLYTENETMMNVNGLIQCHQWMIELTTISLSNSALL